ncbi:MAG: carboxypeptidase-like regulatory domain-containing protein [Mucilaginibacter sp.]
MSAKKPDISQIDQYLKGKLDARAMHKLERQAQDDPFLADALEGYEKAGTDQHANLEELNERLAQRTAPAKQRNIILWRFLPIAASVLLMLGLGYWFFKPAPVKQQYANVITIDKKPQLAESPPAKKETIVKQSDIAHTHKAQKFYPLPQEALEVMVEEPNKTAGQLRTTGVYGPEPRFTDDTTEYIASNYKTRANAKVEEVLKKMEGIEVGPDGSVTSQGKAVTKVRVNGKDFAGGDVTQATRSLPADILDKIQLIDDYGDQAAKTGIKNGDPQKVLNLVTDTINKNNLIANYSPVLREVKINPVVAESKVVGKAAGISTTNNNINNRQVTGTVLDDKGNPLIGATVKVDGAGNAVATDIQGNFKIDLPSNKDLLAVNYVGYNSKQIKVGDQKDLKIALDENQSSLNEVVVVGYGNSAKKSMTGSSTSCNENLKFKKKFFDHIATIKKYTNEQLTAGEHTIKEKTFKKALEFIGKYTKISMDKIAQYQLGYPNMATFEADKKLWLNWYEANKCSNLK